MKTAIYLDDFSDEWVPATTLDGWAEWLYANNPDDGPGEAVEDGATFEVSVGDIDYTACQSWGGKLCFPKPIDWSADTVAISHDDGGGWSADDFITEGEGELQEYAVRNGFVDGDMLWLATMRTRPGDRTVTYRLIDGAPVLQLDGWAL